MNCVKWVFFYFFKGILYLFGFGFEFSGEIWVFFVMALAGIERGRGSREKRPERGLSEGKKYDKGVTILRVLKD